MTRRDFFALLTTIMASAAYAAVAKEPARIAVLGSGREDSPLSVNQMTWLRDGLRVGGLVEGRDFVFDTVWANGDYERFPALAAEVIARRPNTIIVSTIAAAEAAREVSKTIPIVMTGLNDPVGAKLVDSLAHPGGNITGMATLNETVIFKLLEFLPWILPKAKRLAVVMNPTNPSNQILIGPISAQAAQFGGSVVSVELASPAALDRAFEEIRRHEPDVLLLAPDNALSAISEQIVSRALAHRVPVISTNSEHAQAGGILSYGYVRRETIERAAGYLKKILDGAVPADLPVEQPSTFQIVVNLKAARALGIEIPSSLLARADEVIE